jgi:hypothetical protein
MRPSNGIRVGKAGRKGRGVFATKQFLPGDLIERAPIVIVYDPDDVEVVQGTIIESYWYAVDESSCAIALGYASLFNHSVRPNAVYRVRSEEQIIDVTALREIKPRTEITINYNGDPNSRRKVKFKSKNYSTKVPAPDDKKVHYIDQGDWAEDEWVWCGTYGVTWTSVPGLVTCKKCLKFMREQRHALMLWKPDGAEPVPRHELLRLLGQTVSHLEDCNSFQAEVVREAVRVLRKRYR